MKDFYATHGNRQKTKIKLENRNSTITGQETSTLGSEYVTNTQPNTMIHNKIHTWTRRAA